MINLGLINRQCSIYNILHFWGALTFPLTKGEFVIVQVPFGHVLLPVHLGGVVPPNHAICAKTYDSESTFATAAPQRDAQLCIIHKQEMTGIQPCVLCPDRQAVESYCFKHVLFTVFPDSSNPHRIPKKRPLGIRSRNLGIPFYSFSPSRNPRFTEPAFSRLATAPAGTWRKRI